jgi:LPXTG-motif cell wall-anchored protein
MAFESQQPEPESELEPTEAPLPEESSNRTFIIVAGVLGALAVIALVCLVVYALVLGPAQRAGEATRVAQVNAQNTQIAGALTSTAIVAAFTPTSTVTPVPPTATRAASATPVVAVASNTPASVDSRTATVAALLTQAAITTQTVTGPTPTATATGLPSTGFAEDVGLPMLLGLALLLVVVIFAARRLRMAG